MLFSLLRTSVIDEQKKVFEMKSRNQELVEENKKMETKLDAMETQKNERIEYLTQCIHKAQTDYKDLETRCISLKGQLKTMENELAAEYEARLKEKKASNESKLELEDALNKEKLRAQKWESRSVETEKELDSCKQSMVDQNQAHGSTAVEI